MPYKMAVPFLLYPPNTLCPQEIWRTLSGWTQDSKHQVEWRPPGREALKTRWGETLQVEWWDLWTPSLVLLPECCQPLKLNDSALQTLKTSERQSPDNPICHLFAWSPDHLRCSPVSTASPPHMNPPSSFQTPHSPNRTDGRGNQTLNKASSWKRQRRTPGRKITSENEKLQRIEENLKYVQPYHQTEKIFSP